MPERHHGYLVERAGPGRQQDPRDRQDRSAQQDPRGRQDRLAWLAQQDPRGRQGLRPPGPVAWA